MISRFTVFMLLLAMLTVAGCQAEGKPARMAVINAREVVTKCNDGIRVSEELQHQFTDRRNDLKAQEEAIRKLQGNPTLADAKSGKKDEVQRLSNAYLEASQQLRKDLASEEAVKFKPVLDKINKVLAEYAKKHVLLSVQDKNGFAYVDPSIDITEEIIKRVDQVK